MLAATANPARVLPRAPNQAPSSGISRIVAVVLLTTVITWVQATAYAPATEAYDQLPYGYDGMPTVASTQSIANAELDTPAAPASPDTSGIVDDSPGYLDATNSATTSSAADGEPTTATAEVQADGQFGW